MIDKTKEQIDAWNEAIKAAAGMLKAHAHASRMEEYEWAAQLVEDMLIERDL